MFNNLTVKEKFSYSFATVAFFLGWILTFISFFTPPVGMIADSVLWVLGQTLIFCGSILGISQHYSNELTKFKSEISDFVKKDP